MSPDPKIQLPHYRRNRRSCDFAAAAIIFGSVCEICTNPVRSKAALSSAIRQLQSDPAPVSKGQSSHELLGRYSQNTAFWGLFWHLFTKKVA